MRYLLLIPIVIYIGASLWANFDLFGDDFMQYWWFDDLGHILVFGALTLVALTITHRRHTHAGWAISSVALLAVADEFSQLFIPARSFDVYDLFMSLVGVTMASIVFLIWRGLTKEK